MKKELEETGRKSSACMSAHEDRRGSTAPCVASMVYRRPHTHTQALCDAHHAARMLYPVLFISIVSLSISKERHMASSRRNVFTAVT
jgi:hypothetical protein